MNQRSISKVTAGFLALIALTHLLRLVLGTPVEIDGWALPMGASLAALVIAGALAVLLWRESRCFIERRRVPRRRAIHLASLRQSDTDNPDESAVILGRTLEISDGGVTLETSEPLEVGAEMELELAVEAEIVEVRGTVVHVDHDPEGRYSIGVKFASDPADRGE